MQGSDQRLPRPSAHGQDHLTALLAGDDLADVATPLVVQVAEIPGLSHAPDVLAAKSVTTIRHL